MFRFFSALFFSLCCTVFVNGYSSYGNLRSSEVNLRVGPGKRYPISWVYVKSNVPVIILCEFDNWRKIQDPDGDQGWVHQNMISKKRTGMIKSENSIIYKDGNKSSKIARIEHGAIVRILSIRQDVVKIDAGGTRGWVKKDDLWGVDDVEDEL